VHVVSDEPTEEQQLGRSLRRVPVPYVLLQLALGPPPLERVQPRARVPQLRLEDERVVLARLHAHEQAVERGDVGAARVEAGFERLHKGRSRAGEGVENSAAGDVTRQERLDELWDELAQVRVEPVDVLRPLPLRELPLRPREIEIDAAVESVLRRGHGPERVLRPLLDSWQPAT
jgi:hypothetical protein